MVAIGNEIIVYIESVQVKITTNLLKMAENEIEDCSGRAPKPTINIEHTLAIIKPDAMNKADEIVDIILKSGFTIVNVRC